MFQIVDATELAALQDGAAVEGSLGVLYQLRGTGRTYLWNPDSRRMELATGAARSGAGYAISRPDSRLFALNYQESGRLNPYALATIRGRQQFSGTAVYDPPLILAGVGVTTTVTVTGAQLGYLVSLSFSLDLQGISLTGWVSAANTVSARFENGTAGMLDLGSGTITATATAQPVIVQNVDTGNVAWTGSSLSTGQAWYLTNVDATAAVMGQSNISVTRAAYQRAYGQTYPNYLFATFDTLTMAAATYGELTVSLSVVHSGSKLALFHKGVTGGCLVKVNDQFISLTQQVVPNDGALRVLMIDFGSVDSRRVEFLGYNIAPGAIYTDLADSITTAPRRGPKCIILSDSFGEGAGQDAGAVLSWITYFSEYLGWDDVTASALGTTGLIATNGGAKPAYATRVARDVAALAPDVVGIQQSVNDEGQTAAAVLAALQSLVATIQASGNPKIFVTSPSIKRGAGSITVLVRAQNAACKAWCASVGIPYLDWMEMPLQVAPGTALQATTITANASAAAVSITTAQALVYGCHYKFSDGSVIFVRSTSGLTATIDNLPTAQVGGATLAQCGATYLNGTGRVGATAGWGICDTAVASDGAHPTNVGHRLLGYTAASLYLSTLNV